MAVESLSARAYRHVRDEIISGRLHGGAIISEAAVAKSLGMSRTPVGDAIRQLVREGLVDQVPRFGTVVRELGRAELVELYEVREALESYAAAKAASRPDPATLARMDHLCHAIDTLVVRAREAGHDTLDESTLRQFLAADMAFHLTIVQAAGNRRIADFVAMSRSISRIFRTRRTDQSVERMQHAGAYHRRIADAIRNGDTALAGKEMLEHIQLSKEQTIAGFDIDRARGSMGSIELPPEIQNELDQVEQAMMQDRPPLRE